MSRLRKRLFFVVVTLQILFLLGTAATYYATELYGQEIRIKTAPVDPRDLFYGDYVVLNYEIGTIPLSLWKGENPPERNQVIYVALTPTGPNDDVYTISAASPTKLHVGGSEVLLKGQVTYSFDSRIQVRYGFERYYVPEGTGRELEKNTSHTTAIIKVAPWGQATLFQIE